MTTTPRDGSERVAVYILAGGRSRRFGSDKARALVDGVPMVRRVADYLAPVARSTTVVAATAGVYDDLGLVTIGDVVPGHGPLGGLLSALEHLEGGDWLFLTACDWVNIDAGWVRPLLDRRRDAATAVLYRSDRLEPLFALYHHSLAATARRRLEAGSDLSMHGFISDVDAVILPAPPGWQRATNRNTPRA